MRLYRIGKPKYSKDLKGDGAKLNGGRWNHEGIACIYTAESRALCLLEYSVHVQLADLPKTLCFTIFEVPDDSMLSLEIESLPVNWQNWPHSKNTRDFGTQLLRENKYLIFKFPSAVLPFEYNYIINPAHSDMYKVKIIDVVDYAYDTRIKE